jgi:hypothetical protein
MSFQKRQADNAKPARKPATKAAKNWVTKPLTNPQKAQLSIAARAAFDLQNEHGLTGDLKYDDWRREQTEIACGKDSFRDCTNREFRSILARFLQLGGKEAEAAALWANTGRVEGSTELNDTHEQRELCKAILRDKITASRGVISDAYVAAIVRNKHQGKTLDDLTASELQQLIYTVVNRLAKK